MSKKEKGFADRLPALYQNLKKVLFSGEEEESDSTAIKVPTFNIYKLGTYVFFENVQLCDVV